MDATTPTRPSEQALVVIPIPPPEHCYSSGVECTSWRYYPFSSIALVSRFDNRRKNADRQESLRNAEDLGISAGLCGVGGRIAVVRKFTPYRK
jgi:hypothetical protein